MLQNGVPVLYTSTEVKAAKSACYQDPPYHRPPTAGHRKADGRPRSPPVPVDLPVFRHTAQLGAKAGRRVRSRQGRGHSSPVTYIWTGRRGGSVVCRWCWYGSVGWPPRCRRYGSSRLVLVCGAGGAGGVGVWSGWCRCVERGGAGCDSAGRRGVMNILIPL